jgi:hypothetical protein
MTTDTVGCFVGSPSSAVIVRVLPAMPRDA